MFGSNRNHNTLAAVAGGVALVLGVQTAVRLSRRISFRGKSVLITGGSRGLGLVLARECVREGAGVAICARDSAELDAARQDLLSHGADVLAVECDITRREQVEGMVDGVTRHFGGIDVLINNAGAIQVGPHETMTLEDYEEAMQTHFWAPLHTTFAVLPQMKARRAGRIVNVSSIGGKISVPHLLPYSASKFALVGFSEGLRSELQRQNIYVTTVCPGLMRTGSPHNAYFKGRHREEYTWFTIADSLPLASVSARTAARRIIRACKNGEAEVMLSLPARLAATFHGVFPGITSEINAMVSRALPSPGGIGKLRARGVYSQSEWAPSKLTTLTEQAAAANNE